MEVSTYYIIVTMGTVYITSLIHQIPSRWCNRYRCGSIHCNHGNRTEVKEATCWAPWQPVSYLYLWLSQDSDSKEVKGYTTLYPWGGFTISFSAESELRAMQTQRVAPLSQSCATRIRNFEQGIKIAISFLFWPVLHITVPRMKW